MPSSPGFNLPADWIPAGVFRTDAQGRCIEVNRAWTQFTAFTAERALQEDWHSVAVPAERKRLARAWQKAVREAAPFRCEFWIETEPGERRFVACEADPILAADGKLDGFLGLLHDVTIRARLERDLRLSEERYRSFVQHSGEGIYLFELDQPLPVGLSEDEQIKALYRHGYIATCNEVFATMYGRTPAEMAGTRLLDVHGSDDNPENLAFLRNWIRSGYRIMNAISEEYDKDGTQKSFSNNCIGVIEDGCVVRVWASQQDVSARVAAEREVRILNASLERRVAERTAELESFSYMVSHDLRAPLRGINFLSRVLREDHGGQLDEEGHQLLEKIRGAATKMDRLIHDLLAFSRLGRTKLKREPIDVRDLVVSVLHDLQLGEPGDAQVRVGELPAAVGDSGLVRQVWANLLGNAAKFAKPGEPPVIEIGGDCNGKEVRFWVRDRGVGFDPKQAGKLFGVFHRLDPQDGREGTGVGLAIVERIVRRHGGRVWAEGEPGAGAAFFFTMPATGTRSPAAAT